MATNASSLVAEAKIWAGHYGRFPNGEAGAVLSVPLRMRAAWDAGDAAALADIFTANGSMLVDDRQLLGPEEIRTYHQRAFAEEYAGTRRTDEPIEIKFLAPDIAFAVTRGGVLAEGQKELAETAVVCASWVVAKQGGEWKLVSHQTSPVKG